MDQRGISILVGFMVLSVALGLPLALPRAKGDSAQGKDGSAQEQKDESARKKEEDKPPQVDVWADAAKVYGDFFGLRGQGSGAEALSEILAGLEDYQPKHRLEFLIVLVPDPLDSQMPSSFDQALEGIQQAHADSGYLLDRAWLPWSEDNALETEIHRRAPGIVLFRKEPDTLATVLLVGESPKSGIQKEAFINAVTLASNYEDQVRVAGPSFSGSMNSLQLALSQSGKKEFRIVSGTATAPGLREQLAESGSSVEFCRTVVSDEVLQKEALGYLIENMGWNRRRLAFLSEADTSYGRQGTEASDVWAEFSSGTAHVRTAWEKKGARKSSDSDQVVKAPKWALDLSLMEDRKAVDLIPRFDPLSVAESDLALTSLFRTINRERLRYVGIMATDARDKLFLAEQIHRFCPDVLLFTSESDLLFSHPEVGRAMDGMLVLSQYPLYTEGQRGLPLFGDVTKARLRQFSSEFQQGVFQAVHHLVTDTGVPDRSVWISAVGNGSVWPVARVAVTERPADLCANAPARDSGEEAGGARFTEMAERRDLQLLFFMLALYLFASALDRNVVPLNLAVKLYRDTRHSRPYCSPEARRFTRWLWPVRRPRKRLVVRWPYRASAWNDRAKIARVYALALGIVVLWLAGSLILLLGLFPLLFEKANRLEVSEIGLLGLLFFYGLLMWRLGLVAYPYFEPAMKRFFVDSRGLVVVLWINLSLLGTALLFAVLSHLWVIEGGEEVFYFRARAFAGGLSPVIPLLWLGGALYAWSVLEVRRLRLLVRHTPEWPLHKAWEPVLRRLPRAAAQLRRFMVDTRLPGNWRRTSIFIVMVPSFYLFWTTIQPVAEVKAYGRLFLLLCFTTLVLGAISFYRFVSIWFLLERILQRLEHTTLCQALRDLSPKVGWTPMRSFWEMTAFNVIQLSLKKMEDIEDQKSIPMGESIEVIRRALDDAFEARRLRSAGRRRESRGEAFLKEVTAREKIQKEFRKVSKTLAAKKRDPVFESYFAVRIVSYVRHCFLQMRNCLVVALVCGVFTLIAVTTYAFEPKQFFSLTLWIVLVAAVAMTMWIFVQMDRNGTLSAIGGSDAGKVTFDRVFLANVFTYGVIPLLSVVATQFPNLSTYLFRWLNPVLRVAGVE